jgi:hypothetical protein
VDALAEDAMQNLVVVPLRRGIQRLGSRFAQRILRPVLLGSAHPAELPLGVLQLFNVGPALLSTPVESLAGFGDLLAMALA